jgi:hypothetical protein
LGVSLILAGCAYTMAASNPIKNACIHDSLAGEARMASPSVFEIGLLFFQT